jgi:putative ABC transport system substrate-binding protein
VVPPVRQKAMCARAFEPPLDSAPLYLPNFKVWQDSLRDHGWIEGKNLIVDYRSAEGHAERLAPLANELAALKPDVLVGPGRAASPGAEIGTP